MRATFSWRVRAIDLQRQAPKVKSEAKKIHWKWFVNLMVDLEAMESNSTKEVSKQAVTRWLSTPFEVLLYILPTAG
jgi:hypothetical protein